MSTTGQPRSEDQVARLNASSDPGRAEIQLTALELALVGELNLEMAAANDEVAEDPTAPPGTRQAAEESAERWRERARRLKLQAQRLATEPNAPERASTQEQATSSAEPEGRERERRTGERRRSRPFPQAALGPAERRTNRDRRQHDRRSAKP